MAWSSAATDWIIDSVVVRNVFLYVTSDDGKTYKRTVTTTMKHAPAMTYSAADDLATTTKGTTPTADVSVERQNEADAYLVRFSNTEWSAWTEVT
jgi:hypothetical protein